MLSAKEAQDLKTKARKLHLEVEEKNEIINVLKDELVTLRETSDKFQKENLQLVKDAKRVKFLQDENDFLQDKVGSVDLLEQEIKRLKEKLNESEFFKIRIKELEEDLSKSQSECTQFENKWQEADGKLTRVSELEAELNKWKSFSNELEQEKNSIQQKLLESIDQESKLNSNNKKVEDEVRRLRDLIKSYEEERDEEQASNSLIMSVADLKQLDLAEQQRNISRVDVGTDPVGICVQEQGQQTDFSEADVQDREQQTEICDTEEKSIGTDPMPEPKPVTPPPTPPSTATIKAEAEERFRDELDSHRKMISDLRQDLACEKSLTQKLTSQLASFTKQIKSLDKQYFPMHHDNSSTKTQLSATKPSNGSTKTAAISTVQPNVLTGDESKNRLRISSSTTSTTTNANTSDKTNSPVVNGTQTSRSQTSSQNGQLSKPTALKSSANNASERCVVFDSKASDLKQRQASLNSKSSLVSTQATKPISSTNIDDDFEDDDEDEDDEIIGSIKQDKINGLPKSSLSQTKSKHFVRNALPSRSVNFGSSNTSAYLDRIRASVTATTTTNSSSSFNEQSTLRNILITSKQQPNGTLPQQAGYAPNCMLDHQHIDRCFVTTNAARPSQVQVAHSGLPAQAIYCNSNQNFARSNGLPNIAPSRQLDALIDPVAHEHLLMGMMQEQMATSGQQPGAFVSGQHLTEQQVAHMNNLHRQHYFHHLHQLHQMHHLHHMHHLNHNCSQQQPQQQHQHQHQQQQQQQQQQQPTNKIYQPVAGNVGSQFYAPGGRYDQVYSNAPIINNGVSPIKEQQQQQHQKQNGTKLVNKNTEQLRHQPAMPTSLQQNIRVSPQRTNMVHYNNLPQIDEMNGLPSVPESVMATKNNVRQQIQRSSPARSDKDNRVNGSCRSSQIGSNTSPVSLSSPTSSRTSSNISPSSESSSSSGTNSSSLTSSAAPLTRSALRHTTTDLGRRQFSVERELNNSTPLTATLSQVGSYNGLQQHRLSPPKEANQMRNPVQSQQPPMRTSKILNIGIQQANNGHSSLLTNGKTNGVSVVGGLGKISSDLANMKLSDNLAFSSLRVPKKSTNGFNLSNKLVSNQPASRHLNGGIYGNVTDSKIANSSASPQSMLKAPSGSTKTNGNTTNCNGGNNNNNNNSNNNNNNMSVWFEYGCI